MRLHAIGGLCNRLQTILSYRAVYGTLTVVWDMDAMVHFEPWPFEPLGGVAFEYASTSWDAENYAVHPGAPYRWERGYRELVPLVPPVPLTMLGVYFDRYIAIHVRRTDLSVRAILPEDSDESFIEWCDRWPHRHVFLATDNGETQASYQLRLGPRLRVGAKLGGTEHAGEQDYTRHSTLAQAVSDLWACASAEHFKGTSYSSFSDTIHRMRGLK